jgi:DNA invertase Pin-like site-specific DNA recombinase
MTCSSVSSQTRENRSLFRDSSDGRSYCLIREDSRIFTDKITGTKEERPGLTVALSHLRPGDTLVVWRLDRLARSLTHLIQTVNHLASQQIAFKSITEAIDTSSATGKLTFHIFGALAEFERNLIKERTIAGLAAARARGKSGGRPKRSPKSSKVSMANPHFSYCRVAARFMFRSRAESRSSPALQQGSAEFRPSSAPAAISAALAGSVC